MKISPSREAKVATVDEHVQRTNTKHEIPIKNMLMTNGSFAEDTKSHIHAD